MQNINTSTEASVLEHNHWDSARPSPAAPRTSRSSSSLSADSMLSPASGSNHSPTTSTGQRRRRKSHVEKDGEDLETLRPMSRKSGHDDRQHFTGVSKAYNPLDGSLQSSTVEGELSDGLEEGYTDDEEAGLTRSERKKRRRRKERGTSMDSRIVNDGRSSKDVRKLADINVLKRLAVNAVLIGLWYIFSLSISIYNKWMFSEGHLDFHFPLFTTCMHMVVQFTLASTVLFFFPRFRPRHDSITNPNNEDRGKDTAAKKSLMTTKFYLSRIAPCGAATGLDIGLGNMSLRFITLTFFTMCKSSALGFVLLFAFLFRLETPSIKLVLVILTMTAGVIMMVAGEAAFNALGFTLIILSAFFSGFRWALTQILLLRNPATSNPFASIFFLTPIMFLSLFALAVPIETFPELVLGLQRLVATKGTFFGIVLILFPGMLAFCMTSAEFALLKRTSVVTLSICGIFKEVVTISASQYVYHDPLTPINVSGLLVTIASIAAYNYIKIRKMRQEAREREGIEGSGGGAEEIREGGSGEGVLGSQEGQWSDRGGTGTVEEEEAEAAAKGLLAHMESKDRG